MAVILVAGNALTGMAFVSQGAQSQPQSSETQPVLVKTGDVDGVDQYGSLIDSYGNYVLLEVEENDLQQLKQEYNVDLLEERTKLHVKGYEFDREKGLPDFTEKLNFESVNDAEVQEELTVDENEIEDDTLGREIYLLQMIGPRNPEWRQEMEEMGVDFITSVHNYGYEVQMSTKRAEKVADLEYVEWVKPYQPGFKIDPILTKDLEDLEQEVEGEEENNEFTTAENAENTLSVEQNGQSTGGIETVTGEVTETLTKEEKIQRAQPNYPDELVVKINVLEGMTASALMELEGTVKRINKVSNTPEGAIVTAVIDDKADLVDLAQISSVYYISPNLEPTLHEMSSQITGGGSWNWAPQWEWEDPDPPGREPETPVKPYRGDNPEWAPAGARTAQQGYTGDDIIVSVADTGIGDGTYGNPGHPDFTGRIIDGYDYQSETTDEGEPWDGYGHGTAVAGVLGSDGYHGTGNQVGDEALDWTGIESWDDDYYASMGVAPEVEILNTRIANDGGSLIIPGDLREVPEQAKQQEPELFGQTHSWGMTGARGGYSARTRDLDQSVRDANRDSEQEEPLFITFSAGNSGARGDNTVGEPGGTAKNVLSVGGTENYQPDSEFMESAPNADEYWDGASRGYTNDNRIKPDVAAPANNILSTYWYNDPEIDPNYVGYAGTSFSSPHGQGAGAVVADWYQDHPLTTGKPSPAMTRAIITSTAYDLPEDHNGDGEIDHVPNRYEGWGRIDLTPLVDHNLPKGGPFMLYDGETFEGEDTYLTTGDTEEYSVAPMDTDKPLKITLSWDDVAAQAGANPTLQNDLRLKVTGPNGNVYRGNAFAKDGGKMSTSGYSYPGTEAMETFDLDDDGYDDVNNLLSVYIENPEAGSYNVEVIGHDIPMKANDNIDEPNQDFALCVQNSFLTEDGLFMMDSDRYAEEDRINFTVIDKDMTETDTYDILVHSIKDGGDGKVRDSMQVRLKGEKTGVVTGYVDIGPDYEKGEDSEGIKVKHGDEIEARYWDQAMQEYKYRYAMVDGVPPEPASNINVDWYGDGTAPVHNNVTWDLSPDDSNQNFSGYNIYRAESIDGEPGEWQYLDTVGNGTTQYIDENMGRYDYTRYYYQVAATDDVGNEQMADECGLEPPEVRVDAPEAEEIWTSGNEEDIEWYAASGDVDATLTAKYSTDAGETWDNIFEGKDVGKGEGSYTWTVDDVDGTNHESLIKLTIDSSGDSSYSQSEYFTLTEYEPPQFDNINSPTGDSVWYINTTETIDWTIQPGDGDLTSLDLEYKIWTLAGGYKWEDIAEIEDPEAFGDYDWDIPLKQIHNTQIRFHVEDENDLWADEMSEEFKIINAKPPENLDVDHVKLVEEVPFYDSLEGGESESGYETGEDPAGHNEWGVRDHGAYKGDYSWDFGDGMYDKAKEHTGGATSWLISPEVLVPANATWAELTFQHWRDFDYRYDGGNMRISTDGSNWNIVEPEGGYPDTISTAFDNPMEGQPAWTKTVGWEEVTFDLNDYKGETIQFKWQAGVDDWDDDQPGQGWRIDDIEVRAEVPYKNKRHHGDNRLTWDASADDGTGKDNVEQYNIYRCASEGELGEQIASVEADDSEEYRYFDRGAGTEDHKTWHYTVKAQTPQEEIKPKGDWHFQHPEEHKTSVDNAIGYNSEGYWYGAMKLNLSDKIGGLISEVSYYDYADAGDYAQAFVSPASGDGAPVEPWAGSSEKYDTSGAGWVDLELKQSVKIKDPGTYWIVMKLQDKGAGNYPFGIIPPMVEDGGLISGFNADPFDPGAWSTTESSGLDYSWAVEAKVLTEKATTAENVYGDTAKEPDAPYPPKEPEPEDEGAISVQKHERTELSFELGHGNYDKVMDVDFYNAKTDELIGEVDDVHAGERATIEWKMLHKGEHSWYVTVDDGDYLVESEVWTFMVDYYDPEVDIMMPEDGEILGSSTVMAAWQGEDDRAGIDYYEVRLRDYIDWTDVGTINAVTINNVPTDEHTLDVRAVDKAGNKAMDTVDFTVDTKAPTVEITSPQAFDVLNENEVQVEWNGYDEQVNMDYYEVRVNGNDWSNVGLSEHAVIEEGLQKGENIIDVRGTDQAGNQKVASVNVFFDPIEPIVNITSPDEGEVIEDDTYTVEWEGYDNVTNLKEFEVRLDDKGWIDPEPPEENEEVMAQETKIGVVDDTEGYGDDWVDILDEELPDEYTVEEVSSEEALEDIEAYSSYFVHGLDSSNEDEWFEATDGIGTVYTSQNLGPTTLNQRSDVIDDPDSVSHNMGNNVWQITGSHPILEGVAEPGDEVLIHTDGFEDSATFTDTDADVYAEANNGDNAFAVNEDRGDVLLTSVGFGWVLPGQHTDDAKEIVANSVAHVAEPPEALPEPPLATEYTFSDLSDGEHTAYVRGTDLAGNEYIEEVNFTVDTPDAELDIISPEGGVENLTYEENFTIEGETNPESTVYIDGEEVDVNDTGYFMYETTLDEGQNVFDVTAEHPNGDMAETEVYALYLPQLEEMETQINGLENDLEASQEDIESLEDTAEQLDVDITKVQNDLSEELDTLNEKLLNKEKALKEAIENAKTETIEEIGQDIDTLENDIGALESDIQTINEELETMNTQIKGLENDVKANKADIQSLNDKAEQLDVDITKVQKDLSSELETLNEKLLNKEKALKEAIENAKTEAIREIGQDIDTLESDIGTIEGDIKTINKELETLDSVESNVASLQKRLEKVEGTEEELKTDIDELQSELDQIETKELQDRVEQLDKELEKLDEQVHTTQSQDSEDSSTTTSIAEENELGIAGLGMVLVAGLIAITLVTHNGKKEEKDNKDLPTLEKKD